jgi:hypothetical protein
MEVSRAAEDRFKAVSLQSYGFVDLAVRLPRLRRAIVGPIRRSRATLTITRPRRLAGNNVSHRITIATRIIMILYGLCTIVTAAALVASFPSLRPRHVISDIVERGVESQPQASRESLLVATPKVWCCHTFDSLVEPCSRHSPSWSTSADSAFRCR